MSTQTAQPDCGGNGDGSRRIPPSAAMSGAELRRQLEALDPACFTRLARYDFRLRQARGLTPSVTQGLRHEGFDGTGDAVLSLLSAATALDQGVESRSGRRIRSTSDLMDALAGAIKSRVDNERRKKLRAPAAVVYDSHTHSEDATHEPIALRAVCNETPETILLQRERERDEQRRREQIITRIKREMSSRPQWACYTRHRLAECEKLAIMALCSLTETEYQSARKQLLRVLHRIETEAKPDEN